MNICILGWYGTETLGDRAILAGIFKIFKNIEKKNSFSIGSIYSFYSKRTMLEDNIYYSSIVGEGDYHFFNAKDKSVIKNEVINSDIVIMGGGPLMELYELELIYEGFKFAKKKNKKTILFGVGVDVIQNTIFANMIKKICIISDCIILRDFLSKENLCAFYNYQNDRCHVLNDPAFLGVDKEVPICRNDGTKYAVVNFRDVSFSYNDVNVINERLKQTLIQLSNSFDIVYLLPNNTFFIGGDDREFYAKLYYSLKLRNIIPVYQPLNLTQTFSYIRGATVCVGMRYHSILFHTLLNGNNYILDYTNSTKGKIKGFLEMLPVSNFYKERYHHLSDAEYNFEINNSKYEYDISFDKKILESYIKTLAGDGII